MSDILDFVLRHKNHKLKRFERVSAFKIELFLECPECNKAILTDIVPHSEHKEEQMA